jgi:hypothetical protein
LIRYSLGRLFVEKRSLWFLLLFVILGPTTIWIGEVIHEVLGHCLFISLLGGSVEELFISPLAPYVPSRLVWEATGLPLLQKALIASAGMMMSMVFSFVIQLFSLRRKLSFEFRMLLFWLSFWTFINTISYMIIGVVLPFGDIAVLMELGVISNTHLGLVGMILTFPGLYLISGRLTTILSEIFIPGTVMSVSMMFWILLPLPFIVAELARTPGPPPPLIGVSLLVLLLPSSYFILSQGISIVSKYDPREKIIQLNVAN